MHAICKVLPLRSSLSTKGMDQLCNQDFVSSWTQCWSHIIGHTVTDEVKSSVTSKWYLTIKSPGTIILKSSVMSLVNMKSSVKIKFQSCLKMFICHHRGEIKKKNHNSHQPSLLMFKWVRVLSSGGSRIFQKVGAPIQRVRGVNNLSEPDSGFSGITGRERLIRTRLIRSST